MKRIAGLKQVQKALESSKAQVVYVALDAEASLRKKIISLAEEKGVRIVYAETMAQLGKDCGITVASSTAADICD